MMKGPDFDGLSTYPKKSTAPFIASGGVRHIEDVERLKSLDNVNGCVIGKALLGNDIDLKPFFT